MASDRTEKPTARRKKSAKKKGQVVRSRDLGHAFGLVGAIMVLSWTATSMAHLLAGEIKWALARMAQTPLASLDGKEVAGIAIQAAWHISIISGPVAFASVVATVGVQAMQGGWVLTSKPITPNLGRLNPMNGLRRLGFSQGGVEMIKGLIMATTLTAIGYQMIRGIAVTSPGLSRISALSAGALAWSDAMTLLRRCAVALVVFGACDYGLQKWRFLKSNRMTKQEVREDHKLTEGNPEIKGRVRRIQMEIFRKRMLAAVPQATLVVTNPTHYAIALEYHRGSMAAPRVVAKGQNLIAQRIKAIAREHGVPVVENPPLARALYKSVEIGDFIPGALFEAVAEVLAYLIKLRQLAL